MWTDSLFTFAITLFGVSWSCVGLYRCYAQRKGLLDTPNARSSHFAATPTGAGIIFVVLWFGLLAYQSWYQQITYQEAFAFLPALLIAYIGMKDDRKSLPATVRFCVQALAAILSLWVLGDLGVRSIMGWTFPYWAILSIAFVAILWMTNLVNFMDGTDGLAGTGCAIVFGVAGFLLWHQHVDNLGFLAMGLSLLLMGFLVWNWPTARIFMGDSGSSTLGFLMAVFAFMTYKYHQFPITIWLILSSCFWFDATITLLRRFLAGESWHSAHKKHAYQRLVQAGWSHHHVLMAFIVLNSVMAALALWAYYNPVFLTMAFWVSVCLLMSIYLLIEIKRPMFSTWYKV